MFIVESSFRVGASCLHITVLCILHIDRVDAQPDFFIGSGVLCARKASCDRTAGSTSSVFQAHDRSATEQFPKLVVFHDYVLEEIGGLGQNTALAEASIADLWNKIVQVVEAALDQISSLLF